MPRNSQSPPNAVETTSSEALGCAPTSSAHRHFALDDRVPEDARARRPRPRRRRRARPGGSWRACRTGHVAGLERDRPRDVGDELVHVPDHLVGRCRTGRRRRSRGSRSASRGSPSRRRARVRAGTACRSPSRGASSPRRCRGSRAGRSRSPRCSRRSRRPRPPGAMWRVRRADHDRDLALVVQVAAARRPDHVAAVRVQRARRLVEEGGRRAERRLELRAAALVVQVDADDLRRLTGGRCTASSMGSRRPSSRDELVAVRVTSAGAPSSEIRRASPSP